jgi:uncharacterized membrane protein YgdD (TMEM256/DUF423 family)
MRYQTAVQYHFYHVFALAVAGLLQLNFPSKWLTYAGYLLAAGIILFSGSLYTMSFLKAAGIEGVNGLGAITPLGGVAFIAGWFCLFMAVPGIKR